MSELKDAVDVALIGLENSYLKADNTLLYERIERLKQTLKLFSWDEQAKDAIHKDDLLELKCLL